MDGNDTLQFSGMNVQIVNRDGMTESMNGAGSLIVGYNESRSEPENGICFGPVNPDSGCYHCKGCHHVIIGGFFINTPPTGAVFQIGYRLVPFIFLMLL